MLESAHRRELSSRPPLATGFDRILAPIHRWIWSDAGRRVQKLLRFGETEIDGGRDILRAAELTSDPLLRRLYLLHATDEHRHGLLFRKRASAMLRSDRAPAEPGFEVERASAGHGLDDLEVDRETDDAMLAFLHISEKAAASRFAVYRDVLDSDPATRAIFEEILRDEVFHMNYTFTQLVRVSPKRHVRQIWRARLTRLWKAYLRLATALAGVIGGAILLLQYFVVLPLFALFAKRAARHDAAGWTPIAPDRNNASLAKQY